MPRIRRWFPVSQQINYDPEVNELIDTFDEWMFRVWLEILAQTTMTEGVLKGDPDRIADQLSFIWRSKSKRYNREWRANRVRMGLKWMANKGWIKHDKGALTVCKYAQYHRHREHKSSLPTEPNPTEQEKNKDLDLIPKEGQPVTGQESKDFSLSLSRPDKPKPQSTTREVKRQVSELIRREIAKIGVDRFRKRLDDMDRQDLDTTPYRLALESILDENESPLAKAGKRNRGRSLRRD